MPKKIDNLTPKDMIDVYKSYKAAASKTGTSKTTALRKIGKKAKEIPPPQQITMIKLQHGDYPHPRIVGFDSTCGRTIEGLDNQILLATNRFPKETFINKLAYNEKAETIIQVLKAEAAEIGFLLGAGDVAIIDGAGEWRKGIRGVSDKVIIQLCTFHLIRRLHKNFPTGNKALEQLDESLIAGREEFNRIIIGIVKAKDKSTRSARIAELERKPLTEPMKKYWKRLQKDLEFYHTLDEQPFCEIDQKYEVDPRDNNFTEREARKIQHLRKKENGFKNQENTQNLVNGLFLSDRTNAKISKLKREIPEFQPVYRFSVPLQLYSVALVDLWLFTRLYQIPRTILQGVAGRLNRIEAKQFSFTSIALPSFAGALKDIVVGLLAKLNLNSEANYSSSKYLFHYNFPALSNEMPCEEKTLLTIKDAIEDMQKITRQYSGNYTIQKYKVAVDILEAISGINLKPYYKRLLSQGLISNHCPRKWNYARKRIELRKQLEEDQKVAGIKFFKNGLVAYITDPNTPAAKLLIISAGLDKPAIPMDTIPVRALKRNKHLTEQNGVKINDSIYDSDLMASVNPLNDEHVSYYQCGGKNVPLGLKIGELMIVLSPTVITGTSAEKIYQESPSMSDLKINNELGLDYKKARAGFSLREYGLAHALKATDMPKTAEPIKEQGK